MIGQHWFSHKQLHRKTTKDIIKMLDDIGQPTEQYPRDSRLGTFIRRKSVTLNTPFKDNESAQEQYVRTVVDFSSPNFSTFSHEDRLNWLYNPVFENE